MKFMKLSAVLPLVFLSFFGLNVAVAQSGLEGQTYTLEALPDLGSGERPAITAYLDPTNSTIKGDTVFTIYEGGVTEFKMYFVEGDQYDNIFNPNPTGVYINGQEFVFYCSLEKSIRQNFNNILEINEFTMLGKSYLMLINFREDCLGEGCDYRCYNVFDITDAGRVRQISFASIYQGMATFGDFDGNASTPLDFVRVAPKPHESYKKGDVNDHFLVTAYTIKSGSARQLKNPANQQPYYMYVKAADEEVSSFQVLQADWFFDLKDAEGNKAESTSYFAEYISFDPLYKHLYSPDGVRIEKNRWAIHITDMGDLEAAQEYCRRIQQTFEEVYIMIDQYGGNISFQVLVGNFQSKELAKDYQDKLQKEGLKGDLRDLRADY